MLKKKVNTGLVNLKCKFAFLNTKVVIHLTDGLDAQYNIMKERVEQMHSAGKND